MMDMESGVQRDNASLEQKVQQYLDEYEIKHAQEGYQYLVAEISIACRNPQKVYSQIDLRNQVALLFGTRSDCVERAVRYAIHGTNMTNKEFIQRAVDKITFKDNIIKRWQALSYLPSFYYFTISGTANCLTRYFGCRTIVALCSDKVAR